MTRIKKIFILTVFAFSTTETLFAQMEKPVKPEKPYDKDAPYVLHNGGFAWSRVTRIQTQTECSNFVWQDDMLGAFYSIQTGNLPLNFMAKIGAYYPYHYEFRHVEQKPMQIILYSFDFNIGPYWTIPIGEIINLNLAPMVHFRYQLSDEFHHCDLGVGAFAGIEVPVTKKFTVLVNGELTYDCGNLGSNGRMFPYDHVYSYNADIGFRIDSKGRNKFYYIKPKNEREQYKLEKQAKLEERQKKQQEKKDANLAKKQKKAQEKAEYKQSMKAYKEAKKEYKQQKKEAQEKARAEKSSEK